jgi:hypothetical protein
MVDPAPRGIGAKPEIMNGPAQSQSVEDLPCDRRCSNFKMDHDIAHPMNTAPVSSLRE